MGYSAVTVASPVTSEDREHSVVIFYLSVGVGHRIAAEALAAGLARCAPEIAVETQDAIRLAGSRVMRGTPWLHTWLMGRVPRLYDRLWRSKRMAACSWWAERRFGGRPRRAVQQFLSEAAPSVVVTTHGWACRLAASARRDGLVNCHVAIPTDFGMHAYWPLQDVDHYVVSTRQMRDGLVRDGFAPERIHILGIPIRLTFADGISRTDTSLSVPEIPERDEEDTAEDDMPTVLMIAGASGTGYYRRAFAEIHELLANSSAGEAPFRVVVVTGSEGPRKAALEAAAEHLRWPAEILGLVDNMHEIMGAADLLVTKPGGLIVAEGLAKGLPMVLIGPSAGQERANTELLLEEGAAVEVTRSGRLCRQIQQVISPRHRLTAMAERARALGHPNSAIECAKLIKALASG